MAVVVVRCLSRLMAQVLMRQGPVGVLFARCPHTLRSATAEPRAARRRRAYETVQRAWMTYWLERERLVH